MEPLVRERKAQPAQQQVVLPAREAVWPQPGQEVPLVLQPERRVAWEREQVASREPAMASGLALRAPSQPVWEPAWLASPVLQASPELLASEAVHPA